MAHHKRKGPKSTRAGCLLCKPHKRQGTQLDQRQKFSEIRKQRIASEKISAALKATNGRGAFVIE